MTNADEIRTMTDEELADFCWQMTDTVGCPGRPGHWNDWECPVKGTTAPCDSYKCWHDWLKQETKK